MTSKWRLLLAAFLLFLLSGCQLQDSYSGRIILSGSHAVRETIPGELVVAGGNVDLLPGSRVTGSAQIFEGSVQMNGDIDGDVLLISGQLQVSPQATIHGDLNQVDGALNIAPGARILGKTNQSAASSLEPARQQVQAGRLVTVVLELLLLTGLSFMIARFLPGAMANVGQAATRYWLPSAALGLLAWVVGLSLLVLMAYTILLIPLTLLGFFAMLAATTYGAVPYAIFIGRWISERLKWKLSLALQAVLGMAGLVFLVEFSRLIPIIKIVLPLLLFTTSLGAVFLTRFGFQRFIPPNLDTVEEQSL